MPNVEQLVWLPIVAPISAQFSIFKTWLVSTDDTRILGDYGINKLIDSFSD